MSENNEKLARGIELAKAGFENAQARINAIDTKVGIAVGFLVVLLPAPLVVAGWLSGLQNTAATKIFASCGKCWMASTWTGFLLFVGMICAFSALLRGFSCLTPRAPKGYGKSGPFQNEWQPNVLFPLYKPFNADVFCQHLRKLQFGVDFAFVVNEYDHQLHQLGRILDAKFVEMNKSFWWLKGCIACYGAALISASWIVIHAVFQAATP